ncbi:MAG TPA: hypothetical protein VNB22_05425 [Pyrinomonadaceae bacterium]|jgi:hypothetical protein|nr:hypothetical protein [Pyrinomonadaceae bacterium]
MAIWQFSIDFIPRKNLLTRFVEIPETFDDEIWAEEDFEENVDLPDDYEIFLNSLGEKETLKWMKEAYNWGDYDNGTHITVIFNQDKASVYCRFDVGNWDENFARIVLEFAKMCNCVLLTKNKNIIEPKLDLFVEEMRNSNSYRFCKNPIEYLQSDEVKQINWSVRKKLEDDEFNFNR